MTATTAPKFRYIGTTDECVECQKCGKQELRSTVVLVMLDEDGNDLEATYYGSTCAARALAVKGGGRAVLQSARWARDKTLYAAEDARRMLAHYGLPEAGEIDQDTMRESMRRYIQQHPNITRTVAETGVGVRAMVLDMVARKRAAIAEAALLGA